MSNLNRSLRQFTSLERNIRTIGRLPDMTSINRTLSVMNRIPDTTSISRTLSVMNRIPDMTSINRTLSVMNRIPDTTSINRTLSAMNRLPDMTSLNRTLSAMNRLPDMTSLNRTLSAMNRLPDMTSLNRTLSVINRLPDMTLALGQRFLEPLAPFRERARFEEAEWFPHSTFPRHLLDCNGDEHYSDEVVLSYYRENWSSVRQVIERELSECDVDRDSKETVRQALIAHESELYRLVPRSLFPEIERAARVCLDRKMAGRFSVKREFVELVGRLPISALPDRSLTYIGYTQLSHHLYENIHTDEVRERFLNASIPNRHAVIHGLVTYSSEKNSLNAIFVAICVFRLLTVLKQRYMRSH